MGVSGTLKLSYVYFTLFTVWHRNETKKKVYRKDYSEPQLNVYFSDFICFRMEKISQSKCIRLVCHLLPVLICSSSCHESFQSILEIWELSKKILGIYFILPPRWF